MNWLRTIFAVPPNSTLVQRERTITLFIVASLVMVLFTIYIVTFPTDIPEFLSETGIPQSDAIGLLLVVLLYALGVAAIFFGRRGLTEHGSYIVILMMALSIGSLGMLTGYDTPASTIPLILMIVLGGLLNGIRGFAVASVIALGMYFAGVNIRFIQNDTPVRWGAGEITVILELFAAASITYLFLRQRRHSQMEGFAGATQDRLRLAEIMTGIAHDISSRSDLSSVLARTVEQIIQTYPRIYHAQIFLLDDSETNAELVASTGAAGRLLLQRKHALEVGSASVIGRATSSGEHVIARAGAADSIHRRNEFLPDTVAEAAFPLRIGGKIIGALDLQSKQADVFHDDDLPIFQALADNLAVAIDNARLFEETQRQLASNQQLIEQSQRAIQEVERLNRQLIGRAWERFLQGREEKLGMAVDFEERRIFPLSEPTETLAEAISRNEVVHEESGSVQTIAVPLRVRGQVIGAMEFDLPNDGHLTPEDLQLVQEVGERFGIAMENARLFEESQRIAYREAMVSEIGSRLQASNDVDAVLTEAARSLQQTLNVGKVAIRLGAPPVPAKAQGNGQSS